MKRPTTILLLCACSGSLVGCTQTPDSGPEIDPLQLAEGLWSVSQTIFTVEAEGDGAEDAKQMAGRQVGDKYCLSSADATRGMPALLEKTGWGACQQNFLAMNPDSERLEGAYSCATADGSKTEVTVQGALDLKSVDFTMERTTTHANGKGTVTMNMMFGAERQGACAEAG